MTISIINTHVHLYNFCQNNAPLFPQNPWFLPKNYVLPLLLIKSGISGRVLIDLPLINHIVVCMHQIVVCMNFQRAWSRTMYRSEIPPEGTLGNYFKTLQSCENQTPHLRKKNWKKSQFLIFMYQANLCFWSQNREKNHYTLATHLGTRRFSSLIFSPFYYSLHLIKPSCSNWLMSHLSLARKFEHISSDSQKGCYGLEENISSTQELSTPCSHFFSLLPILKSEIAFQAHSSITNSFVSLLQKIRKPDPLFYLIYRARFSAGINWSSSTGVKENILINTCQSSALHIMFAESMA